MQDNMLIFIRCNFIVVLAGLLFSLLLSSCSNYSFVSDVGVADVNSDQLSTAIILQKINGVRKAHGKKPLKYNFKLANAAQTHSNLMASKGKLSHELGGSLRQRVTNAGYIGAVGENLAGGHETLEAAINGWLNSPPHRSTLLNEKFSEFGLAQRRSNNGKYSNYWTFIAGGDFAAWR